MRILHLSDFHLDKSNMDISKNLVEKLLIALKSINNEKKIDLVLFTGDMIDMGGKSFDEPKIKNALKLFEEIFINPLIKALNLTKNRFIFTIGNHEVDYSKKYKNNNEDTNYTNELIDKEILQSKNIEHIEEYNQFREGFWNQNKCDVNICETKLQYGLKFEIKETSDDKGIKVGINCLNSVWKSNVNGTPIILGKRQITDMQSFFRDCNIVFAIAHHDTNMLKEFESGMIKELIAKNYDAYFCGHKHSCQGEYVNNPQGSYLIITSPGLLNNNESAEIQYRNGFVVVDYDEDSDITTSYYYQNDNTDFILDKNYGIDGIWNHKISGSTKLRQMSKSLFGQAKKGRFLENAKILDIINKLKDKNNKTIQFVALSGLGKTRILREAFDNGEKLINHYYCEYSDDLQGLLYDIDKLFLDKKNQEGVLVLDNCPNHIIEKVIIKRNEYSSNFRIIGVNNEFYDRKNISVQGLLRLMLEPDDVREITNKYIEESIPDSKGTSNEKEQIKKISDGFPGMAIILVEEYLTDKQINIHSVDHIVKRILKFENDSDKDKEIVLRTLALFQPFPYNNKEAYKFIREDSGITPLYGKEQGELRRLFNSTIFNFDKSIIEISNGWLNVRPLPLAIWLVSKWFEDGNDQENIDEIIERIQNLGNSTYEVIKEGLCKRLEYMQDSISAQEMIYKLTGGINAPFCNEKVVCSDLGSRLFLAMSSVNPGAVAECIYNVLINKDINWVKFNIVDDIRRNLVWTLEKLCFSKEGFYKASRILALFAVAENETWGNNATGQFIQLFHIMLPGTEVTLQERIELLEYLINAGDAYKELTIKCIDNAFYNGHFTRTGSASHFGIKNRIDYAPKSNAEIINYWEKCREILIQLINENETIIERVEEIVADHIYGWSNSGMLLRLFPIIKVLLNKKQGKSENIYIALSKVKNRMYIYSKDFQNQVEKIRQEIKPNTFNQNFKDARIDVYNHHNLSSGDNIEYAKKISKDLVKDFIDNEIYKSRNELKLIVLDKEYYDLYFSHTLFEVITDEQLQIFLSNIIEIIKEYNNEFNSTFILRICSEFRDRKPMRIFLHEIYQCNFISLYIRLMSIAETKNFDSYNEIKGKIRNNEIGVEYIDLFLKYCSLNSDQIGKLIQLFYMDFHDRILPLMSFICRYSYEKKILTEESTLRLINKVIIEYPILENNTNLNYEYARFLSNLLKDVYNESLAVEINKKLMIELNSGYFHKDLEGIYSVLLEKYSDCIWEDFKEVFISDKFNVFLYQINDEIGSGFSFSSGPLFEKNSERLRELCIKYPDFAPLHIAGMIPIFADNENFSNWFIWLLDNFGNKKEVLDALSSNMETYSWTGSIVPLLKQKEKSLLKICNHKNANVSQWAQKYFKLTQEELKNELSRESYERLRYS